MNEGRILHHFLRFVIDEHDLSFLHEYSFYDIKDDLPEPRDLHGDEENLCELVAQKESTYSEKFKHFTTMETHSKTKIYTRDRVLRMVSKYVSENKEKMVK